MVSDVKYTAEMVVPIPRLAALARLDMKTDRFSPVDTGNQLFGEVGYGAVRSDDPVDIRLHGRGLHVFVQDFYHHATGHLAALWPPHAVRNGVQVHGVIDQHAVFVVDLALSDVCDSGCFDDSHEDSLPFLPVRASRAPPTGLAIGICLKY
jgi:hypothetical protein